MLKGKEFGQAIDAAITLKIQSGRVRSKAEIARHFGIRPPSLADWVKKGSISKEKLPALWAYFSDVVGPEHWGMTASEWPTGLTNRAADGSLKDGPAAARLSAPPWPLKKSTAERIQALTPAQQRQVDDALDVMLRGFEADGKK